MVISYVLPPLGTRPNRLPSLVKWHNSLYKEKLELPKIYDPVFDENKKEERKPAKKGKEVIEEPVEVVEEPPDYTPCHIGKREFVELPVHYNLAQLTKSATELIPAPVYPDPNLMPVDKPIFHHIVSRPSTVDFLGGFSEKTFNF